MRNKIYTLGPSGTDSENALKYWLNKECKNIEIVLKENFEEIFNTLNKDEHIFMPVGFTDRVNKNGFLSWVDFHFYYYKELEICDLFYLDTKTMILVENKSISSSDIVLHSSTYQFYIKSSISNKDIKEIYCESKIVALNKFIKGKNRYAIVSKENFYKNIEDTKFKWKIIEEFNPTMAWIVYRKTS